MAAKIINGEMSKTAVFGKHYEKWSKMGKRARGVQKEEKFPGLKTCTGGSEQPQPNYSAADRAL